MFMCRSVRCIIFCFWQQLNIGSPLVGWPPLRRSPVGVCVALHVVANDVATGWLAAAPPCPCCGFACCSMLLLGLCRRRICAVAVVMLSHAFPDPPDPVHLHQSSTRTEAIEFASCAARLAACLQNCVPHRQAATARLVGVAGRSLASRGELLRCQAPRGRLLEAGRQAAPIQAVQGRSLSGGPGLSLQRHVIWRKARTEAVADAVVVCCVVVGSDIFCLVLLI